MKQLSKILLAFMLLALPVGMSAQIYELRPPKRTVTKPSNNKKKKHTMTAEEMYTKAYDYSEAKDYVHAVEWFKKAADKGHADAQCGLGYCYDKGQGVQQDYSLAVYWYRKAAEQGNAIAQSNLGYCYYNGWGVQQDYSLAVYWYWKGADQGNSYAQNGLGNCYYMGRGVAKDVPTALPTKVTKLLNETYRTVINQ